MTFWLKKLFKLFTISVLPSVINGSLVPFCLVYGENKLERLSKFSVFEKEKICQHLSLIGCVKIKLKLKEQKQIQLQSKFSLY